jgi:glycerol 3-phosphatase-2
VSSPLPGSSEPLLDRHDRLLLDLDGVCYVGDRAIPAAVEAMRAVRSAGLSVRFLTNNASRTPDDVADRLTRFGITAAPDEIVTSAGCAARLLGDELPAGAPVLVVGGAGLVTAIAEVGLRPVSRAAEGPVAVVQGWAPDVGWRLLAEAATAIHAGAAWIATNLDATIPSERGRLPGNGALVGAVRAAVEQEPRAIGKPEPAMYGAAGADAAAPLAVGDRLDTDILGAVRGAVPSLLVMTGVTGPRDLLGAVPEQRPTHIGPDLRSVCAPMPAVDRGPDGWSCRGARATAPDATAGIRVTGDGGEDGLDRLRVACAAVWELVDGHQLSGDQLDELDLDL